MSIESKTFTFEIHSLLENPWVSEEKWLEQKEICDESLYKNRRCWAGLYLGSTQDLTALVLVFEPTEADPFWRLKPYFWVPDEGLAKKSDADVAPYDTWASQGHIETSPGRAVSRSHVAKRISQIAGTYDIQAIACDRWRVEYLIQTASEEQLTLPPLTPFGQGFRDMSPAINEFETRLVNKQLKHDGNPCMSWCVANTAINTNSTEEKIFKKANAGGRIGGTVAAAMAIGLFGFYGAANMQKEKSQKNNKENATSIESQFRFIENVLKTMSHLALLKPGIVKAITFAANNCAAVQLTDDEYSDVMDVFQDLIPEHLIDPNQWWFGHYWSSGHTCSKCREISQMFPCDEPVTDQHFEAISQSMKQGHEPDCSARTAHEFSGLKVCIALRGLIDSEKSQLSQQEGGAQ